MVPSLRPNSSIFYALNFSIFILPSRLVYSDGGLSVATLYIPSPCLQPLDLQTSRIGPREDEDDTNTSRRPQRRKAVPCVMLGIAVFHGQVVAELVWTHADSFRLRPIPLSAPPGRSCCGCRTRYQRTPTSSTGA